MAEEVANNEESLAKAKELIDKIAALRTSEINYRDHGLTTVDARSVSLCKEGLTWRIEELSRTAIALLNAGDTVASLCLMRAVIETAATCWYVSETMSQQIAEIDRADRLHLKTLRIVTGAKTWDDVPQAINVKTFIKHVENAHPGIEKGYDLMSEFAHPNWAGTMALYSKRDDQKGSTMFGQNMRTTGEREYGVDAFIHALEIFLEASEKVRDLMPDFIVACELAPKEEEATAIVAN